MGISVRKLFRQTFEDHKGRKGKVGGSLPRGRGSSKDPDMTVLKEISSVEQATEHGIFGKGSFIYRGKVYDSHLHHEKIIHELGYREGYRGVSDFLKQGGIRVRSVDNKFLYIQGEFDASTRKSFISDIQEYADDGLFGDIYSYETLIVENNFLDPDRKIASLKIETNGTDFMNGEFTLARNSRLFIHGGPGSGFTGHRGRKGLVGGSSKDSAVQYREFSHNRSGDTFSWGKQMFDEANLSTAERESIYQYKGDSNPINEKLRSGKLFPDDLREYSHIRTIDRAIAKSATPEDVLTFRGINRNAIGPDTGDYTGVEFTDKGFVSTTLHLRSALGWSWMNQDPVGTVVQIRLPKGSSAIFTDDVYDRGEYELLLPRDMKFRVVKDETVDRFDAPDPWRLLTVEVIP